MCPVSLLFYVDNCAVFLCLVSLFHVFNVFVFCVINLLWQYLQCFICLVKVFFFYSVLCPVSLWSCVDNYVVFMSCVTFSCF